MVASHLSPSPLATLHRNKQCRRRRKQLRILGLGLFQLAEQRLRLSRHRLCGLAAKGLSISKPVGPSLSSKATCRQPHYPKDGKVVFWFRRRLVDHPSHLLGPSERAIWGNGPLSQSQIPHPSLPLQVPWWRPPQRERLGLLEHQAQVSRH